MSINACKKAKKGGKWQSLLFFNHLPPLRQRKACYNVIEFCPIGQDETFRKCAKPEYCILAVGHPSTVLLLQKVEPKGAQTPYINQHTKAPKKHTSRPAGPSRIITSWTSKSCRSLFVPYVSNSRNK